MTVATGAAWAGCWNWRGPSRGMQKFQKVYCTGTNCCWLCGGHNNDSNLRCCAEIDSNGAGCSQGTDLWLGCLQLTGVLSPWPCYCSGRWRVERRQWHHLIYWWNHTRLRVMSTMTLVARSLNASIRMPSWAGRQLCLVEGLYLLFSHGFLTLILLMSFAIYPTEIKHIILVWKAYFHIILWDWVLFALPKASRNRWPITVPWQVM